MRRLRKAVRVTAAAAVALGTTSATTAVPAFGAEAATHYVALGDSYSSGTGTRDYYDNSGDCLRSPKAYPKLWADSHKVGNFTFAACSGATTDDLNADQLDSLNSDTSLVTVSIGGNDIGFTDVIQDCLLGTDDRCDDAVGEAEEKARDELPDKLDTTYAKISSAAPNARVVVVGYPRLNDLGDCGIPGFSETKRKRINAAADVVARVISQRASAAGFRFADPRGRFDDHGVCSEKEWINGPSNPLQESFHPNVDGHSRGYLPTVKAITG
jgi:lysophospholipase L1-like esterase